MIFIYEERSAEYKAERDRLREIAQCSFNATREPKFISAQQSYRRIKWHIFKKNFLFWL